MCVKCAPLSTPFEQHCYHSTLYVWQKCVDKGVYLIPISVPIVLLYFYHKNYSEFLNSWVAVRVCLHYADTVNRFIYVSIGPKGKPTD